MNLNGIKVIHTVLARYLCPHAKLRSFERFSFHGHSANDDHSTKGLLMLLRRWQNLRAAIVDSLAM